MMFCSIRNEIDSPNSLSEMFPSTQKFATPLTHGGISEENCAEIDVTETLTITTEITAKSSIFFHVRIQSY